MSKTDKHVRGNSRGARFAKMERQVMRAVKDDPGEAFFYKVGRRPIAPKRKAIQEGVTEHLVIQAEIQAEEAEWAAWEEQKAQDYEAEMDAAWWGVYDLAEDPDEPYSYIPNVSAYGEFVDDDPHGYDHDEPLPERILIEDAEASQAALDALRDKLMGVHPALIGTNPEPLYTSQHDVDFTDAHLLVCAACCQEYAESPGEDEDDEPEYDEDADLDYDPWIPYMTTEQFTAEVGFDGWHVTGPKPARTWWSAPDPLAKSQQYVRVWEIARQAGLESKDVITLLTNNGEYVRNHMSMVAKPVAAALIPYLTAA